MNKCLYIAVRKIKSFLTENPFIFVMFFLGSIACSLMFLYFWGNLRYTVKSYQAVSYTATLQTPKEIDVAALFDMAETYDARMDAICLPGNRAVGGPAVEAFLALDDANEIGFLCTNRIEDFYLWGCEREALEEAGTAVAPDTVLLSADLPADQAGVTLMGRELRIIGRTASRYFFISAETFRDFGLIPTEIRLTLPPDLSSSEKDAFPEAFAETCGNAYTLQDTTQKLPLKELLTVVLPMLLVYLLCMFAMLYILVYFLEGMAYELSVYGLLGASNRTLIVIPAIVQGVLLAIANGIACLLHILLYAPLFSRINLYDFAYSHALYAEAVLLMLALSFAVMLLYLKHRIGNYAVVNFRKNLR